MTNKFFKLTALFILISCLNACSGAIISARLGGPEQYLKDYKRPARIVEAIKAGKVVKGMTREDVYMAKGVPEETFFDVDDNLTMVYRQYPEGKSRWSAQPIGQMTVIFHDRNGDWGMVYSIQKRGTFDN